MNKKLSVLFLGVLFSIGSSQAASRFQKIVETHPFPERVIITPGTVQHDILWIIDNSGSMDPYQKQIIQDAPTFFSGLQNTSGWQSAILSTSDHELGYGFDEKTGKIQAGMGNAAEVFSKFVSRLGTAGNSTEKVFTPILNALKNYPAFFGQGHALDIILVTDAPEQSGSVVAKDVIDALTHAMLIPPTQVSFYAFLGATDLGCTDGEGLAYAGSAYEDFLKQTTSGKVFKLCESMTQNLSFVSSEIAKTTGGIGPLPKTVELPLAGKPDPLSIDVFYNGNLLKPGRPQDGGYWYFDYRKMAVVVHSLNSFVLPGVKEIQVSYENY